MANLNQVSLMGYLGKDPELRTMPDGTAVANLSIATSKAWTDKVSGERKEKTEWHRVIVFKRLAEVAGQYLKKGSNVFVQGELIYKNWSDKQGVKHTTAEIQANLLQILGSGQQNQSHQQNSQDNLDSDIPF